jgi:hypothetical protein
MPGPFQPTISRVRQPLVQRTVGPMLPVVPNYPDVCNPPVDDHPWNTPSARGSAQVLGGRPSAGATPVTLRQMMLVPAEDTQSWQRHAEAKVHGGLPQARVTPPSLRATLFSQAEDAAVAAAATILRMVAPPPLAPQQMLTAVQVWRAEDHLQESQYAASAYTRPVTPPIFPPFVPMLVVTTDDSYLWLYGGSQQFSPPYVTPLPPVPPGPPPPGAAAKGLSERRGDEGGYTVGGDPAFRAKEKQRHNDEIAIILAILGRM